MKSKQLLRLFFSLAPVLNPLFAQEKPLFTLLPAEKTAIDFVNQIADSKEQNVLIYSNFYGGAGVGIADFNGDGLQDIYLAGNLVGDRLYINLGNLQFQDFTQDGGIVDNGGWSSGVVVADVNNDGWPDIYVTRELYDDKPELRRNKLYINNGAAAASGEIPLFKECAATYGVDNPKRTRHAVFFDYDKDGWLDLFLLNQPPNPGNFSDYYGVKPGPQHAPTLYHNNGNETFTDVTQAAGVSAPGYPNSVSAADFNNDGYTDLYIAHDFEAPDKLYINDQQGAFVNVLTQAVGHISYFSMGVDAADINNDGWLDIMAVDMVAEDNYRIKSNMSGMNPKSFWKVVENGGHYQYMFNTLQLNNGLIRISDNQDQNKPNLYFSDIAQMAGVSNTDWSWSNLIADFDNDGFKDIHVTNGLMRDIRNTDSDKKFSHHIEHVIDEWIKKNPNAGDVSIWDILDLGEAMEIVPSVKLSNYAYRNNGDLTFSKVNDTWGLDQETFSNGSAFADLDNDGDLDLVINNVNDVAFIYRNNARELSNAHYLRVNSVDPSHNPVFGTRIEIKTGESMQLIELTNVRGMYSTSENIAHFGLGNVEKVDELTITWPDGNTQVLKNITADQEIKVEKKPGNAKKSNKTITAGKALFSLNELIDFTHKEDVFDDYEKQILLPHKMSQFGPALTIADVNGDGLEDCFIGGASDQAGALFEQQKDGTFKDRKLAVFSDDQAYEDMDAAFFDADNDGDLDLYVVSGGNSWDINDEKYKDRLYINLGNGEWERNNKDIPGLKDSGGVVKPYDFDGDGDLDLFIGGRLVPWNYPQPANSRILLNDEGKFKDVTKAIAPDLLKVGMVTDATWMDVNDDQFTDLVLVGEWMPLTFLGFDGQNFKDITGQSGLENSVGWWYSIESGDIDQDGDLDLVAGNLGLNYKYKASDAEPFEVHYDDFDENGSKDIVLSYYNFGNQFPLRGRSCSSQQIPEISEKFESYNLFASALLTDVYGEENLSNALHYSATQFASLYIENQGGGKFKTHLLPNNAQISSVNDILIRDFDGDKITDILLAGNLFTSEIETTRNDAGVGLFLKGDGKGNFKPISPFKSNLLLPFDVKKLGLINTPKGNYLIAAVNDGKLVSYKLK